MVPITLVAALAENGVIGRYNGLLNSCAPGIVVAPNVEAARPVARGDALRRGADCIIVAGGADLYAQTMPLAERLHITYVHRAVDGDVYFPAIDRSVWHETARDDRP